MRHYTAGNRHFEPIKGCDAYEYVQMLNPNAFIIIPECCLWYDPRMLDDRSSGSTLGEALRYGDAVTNEANQFMLRIWSRAEPHLKTETPWRRMVEENIEPLLAKYTNVSNPPFEFGPDVHTRKISVAEKIGIEGHDDLYRMFPLGGMYRMLDEEFRATCSDTIEKLRDEVHRQLLEYDRFLHDNYEVVNTPIKNLVGMGIGAL